MYYYLYYVFSRFAKRYNNRDGDFAFTTIFYLILFIGLNIATIIMAVKDKAYFRSHAGMIVFISAIVPAVINYFVLIRNKKYLEVIQKYDTKYIDTPVSNSVIIVAILYVLLTLILVTYMALSVRVQAL